MESILFRHNQKAYEAAASMLARTGRAAVIHPTGTGKSFLAFQLCADHAGERFCWLSPSDYIFRTQKEKWEAAGGAELRNIDFLTYARLMRLGEDGFRELLPDYIILDEFHRLGAARWGSGVERLREMYPGAKVLGLSATNIRYLDNRRDMAWELFGGNIASELTLGAAVAAGILPSPKYVLSVYSYRQGFRRYEERVRQTKNKAVRDAAEKELEALRRALEKADGLAEVFSRHIKKDSSAREGQGTGGFGRYIVFCANYGHLLAMRELAAEWFAKVDSAPHIYTAYSDDAATAGEFEAFKTDKSPHLKLLYCIDMLNEGIHVDGVDGVILLRPTVSPTVYKQQIGRALAAGGKKTPVIFDIVMNIENLCSVGAIEEELREAVFAFRENGRGGEIVTEHFRVVDEIRDCRRLFAQLNETLAASWEAMYAMAKEYYAVHGNLEISASYTTPDGYSLGAWITTQRKVYAGKTAGTLDARQIKKLEEIGMRWQGVHQTAWERNFAEAEKYFREHGNLAVSSDYVSESGFKLGRWLRRQREVYRALNHPESLDGRGDASCPGNFEAASGGQIKHAAGGRKSVHMEHVKQLTKLGMVWESEDPWEFRFGLAKQYYEEHGSLKMAEDYVVRGVWLKRWLREQKARLAEEEPGMPVDRARKEKAGRKPRGPLTQEQKEKLALIGLVSGVSQAELSWREQYGQAEEFYREHGNLSIPKRYTAGNGKNLGIWLQHQRANRRSGRLSGWQVRMLDGIGMVWEASNAWESGFAHAKEYARRTGNLEVPNAYVCGDGYRLGKWISNQRCAYGGGAKKGLSDERVKRLEEIGMVWSVGQGRRAGKAGVLFDKE